MKVAGRRMNDAWVGRILGELGVETERRSQEPCELGVLVEQLDLDHHGKDRNYRPYLHLRGELRSVQPTEGSWAHGIKEVEFTPGHGERVDAFYEFTDDQLRDLVAKGYFQPGFAVPAEVTGIEWKLQTTVDTLIVAPQPGTDDVPLVFVRAHDTTGLQIDQASSGYELVEYFHEHSGHAGPDHQAQATEATVRRTDEISSLFDDEDEADAPTEMRDEAQETDRSDLTRQIREAEEKVRAETEEARRIKESEAGTPEHIYRQRVAAAIEPEPSTPPATPAAGASVRDRVTPGTRDHADLTGSLDLDESGEDVDEQGTDLEL